MINADVAKKLNAQLNGELYASHLYLAIAAYFESEDLPGIASWFRAHSDEEKEHAMKIYDFVAKRGARIDITGVAAPQTTFASPLDAFDKALEHEILVTRSIHEIFELANETKEYGTGSMLQWFLEEQVEEEDTFRRNKKLAEFAGDDKWNLQELDARLGSSRA